jgi:hypothetical protein
MSPFTIQRLCTWGGLLGVVLFFLGFAFSGFIPPPSPSLTQEAVAAHYQQHATGIRSGMVLMMISGMFIPPLVGVIAAQMKRIPGLPPALIYAQISAGTANSLFFFIPPVLFIVTAFRPERSPELTYLMNDLSWIMAVIEWPPAFMQNLVIGIAVLHDKSPRPVFPRWVAYVNFWVALAFVPGGLLAFFKSGPFAWNGALVFWLAGSTFFVWFIVMTVTLLKAIRQEQESAR